MSHENIMRLWNDCVSGGTVRPLAKIKAKTSAYTITPVDFGTVFTTRGATSTVIFTLPAVTTDYAGEFVLFANVADYDMVVAGTDGEVVCFNDLTANNVGIITSGERIGAGLLAICDGTSWIILTITQEATTIAVDTSPSTSPSHTASHTSSPSTSPSHTSSPSHTASHTSSPSHTPSST